MIMRAIQLGRYDGLATVHLPACRVRDLHDPVPAGHRHRDHHRRLDHGAPIRPRRHAMGGCEANYDSFVRWGRMWEVELITLDVLKRPSSVKNWLTLGPKMMLKGKINPTLKRGDTLAMKRMVQTAESITRAHEARAAKGGPS
jgi:hypothetical protein